MERKSGPITDPRETTRDPSPGRLAPTVSHARGSDSGFCVGHGLNLPPACRAPTQKSEEDGSGGLSPRTTAFTE